MLAGLNDQDLQPSYTQFLHEKTHIGDAKGDNDQHKHDPTESVAKLIHYK